MEPAVYCPPRYIDSKDGAGNTIAGEWREDEDQCMSTNWYAPVATNIYRYIVFLFVPLLSFIYSRSAASMLNDFKDYFGSLVGEVSWQYAHVCRTKRCCFFVRTAIIYKISVYMWCTNNLYRN